MALPSFAVAGGPSVTLSRGPVYALEEQLKPRQRVGQATSGAVKVATWGPPDVELLLQFDGLSAADRDGVQAFLAHPAVNYAATAVTYTDTDGAEQTVRFVDSLFTFSQTAPGRFQLSLRLRKE